MQNKSNNSHTKPKSKNILEKHPKITLLVILFILFILTIFIAEQILGYQNRSKKTSYYDIYGIERYIIFREGRPFSSGYQIPSDDILNRSDNLEKKKYQANYDSNGFLEPSEVHKNPDYKIFFLGGSTTECFYNDAEKRFTYLSGRFLEKKTGFKVNSYNSARSGNNSAHSINILYNKLFALNPSVVILMHNCNDLATISVQGSFWNNSGKFPQIEKHRQNSSLHSIIYGTKDLLIPNLYSRVIKLFQSKTNIDNAISSNKQDDIKYTNYIVEFERNLNIFISMCKYGGTIPVLMTQANRLVEKPDNAILEYHKQLNEICGLPLTYQQLRELHKLFNNTIRKLGQENNVLVVDLDILIPKNKEYIFDAYHLTDRGSALASEIIAESLKEIILKY